MDGIEEQTKAKKIIDLYKSGITDLDSIVELVKCDKQYARKVLENSEEGYISFVLNLHKKGRSIRQIAGELKDHIRCKNNRFFYVEKVFKLYGLTVNRINVITLGPPHKRHVKVKNTRWALISDEKLSKIIDMHELGFSPEEISSSLSLSLTNVKAFILAYNDLEEEELI